MGTGAVVERGVGAVDRPGTDCQLPSVPFDAPCAVCGFDGIGVNAVDVSGIAGAIAVPWKCGARVVPVAQELQPTTGTGAATIVVGTTSVTWWTVWYGTILVTVCGTARVT